MKLRNIIFFIFSVSIFFSTESTAGKDVAANPYDTIRYHDAFDQDNLYTKYERLMYDLGCASNVFSNNHDDLAVTPQRKHKKIEESLLLAEFEQFQKDCIDKLNKARFMSLTEPGIESGVYISLMSIAALVTIWCLGKESIGGSYAGYSAIFSAADKLGGLGKSVYNLFYLPNNSLESLENYFAKNKCFIPKVLWSKITNAFIDVRQSDALKEKSINFLKFALGFILYKPKSNLFSKDHQSILEIKHELNQRIDRFFSEYNINQGSSSLVYIKINVSKFIDSLFDKNSKRPRYVYLHGLGGIGKTHFVQTLASWIQELLPEAVYYQDLIINSLQELEGDAEKPGAFLKVLRSQAMNNNIGSIVMLDEATWLNNKDMVSAAKRIFNGDRTRLSTAYFGTEIDGSSVALDMPPMLIFVASNDELEDPALASRFDVIDYPTPSKQMLINYAYKITEKSMILREADCVVSYDKVAAWIETIASKNLNFRYISGNIEGYCLNR